MANRHERRKAEKLARTQFSKDELLENWRTAQQEAFQLRQMYQQLAGETQAIRQKALQTHMALLAVMYEHGPITVEDETLEAIEDGVVEGWSSEDTEDGIRLVLHYAEDFEDDAE